MLTKSDLAAIQKMFDSSRKETNLKFLNIDKKFAAIDKKIDNLSKGLQNTTEELVELITTGFNLNEERFGRIEAEVFKSN